MSKLSIEDETFTGEIVAGRPLAPGEYTGCKFLNCDLSNADFSSIHFLDCQFQDCNLSLAKLNKTMFSEVQFNRCKMLGLHFEHCNPFGFAVYFSGCMMDHSCFYRMKMKKGSFTDSKLQEVDFTECDLSSSTFENCDLADAIFDQTVLEKADFRTSFNYTIDPERNKLKKAKFSLSGSRGLLTKYDILISD